MENEQISLEDRRHNQSRIKRNLLGLTQKFEDLNIHKNYLNGIEKEDFCSGLDELSKIFKSMYTEMIKKPQVFGMKNDNDIKGFFKNINFLLLVANKSKIKNRSLVIDGNVLSTVMKEAKVTKPEMFFKYFEHLGFITTGLEKKLEISEKVIIEFPDNNYLLIVLKTIIDAICMFSKIKPNHGNIYFEFLDHRILEHYPAIEPKPSMDYVISKISKESRSIVSMFYEYIKSYAKCEIKGSFDWYLTPTFTLIKNKRVIMSFKLTLDSYDIKLNLANIGKYVNILDDFPENILNEIKNTGWECGNCKKNKNDCAFSFNLAGKSYRKCRCGSFIFIKPDKNDSKLLLKLLKEEIKNIN